MTNLSETINISKRQFGVNDESSKILKSVFNTNEDFYDGRRKLVTPEIAKQLLSYNTKNRKLNKTHVAWLAAQMKHGLWMFTGETLKVTTSGRLPDKQHTLHAIIASDKPQEFIVVGSLSDDIINVIDTGKKRTAGDVLRINDVPNAQNLAATIARWLALTSGNLSESFNFSGGTKHKSNSGTGSKQLVNNATILELALNSPIFLKATNLGSVCYDLNRSLAPSQWGVLYCLLGQKDEDSAYEFLTKTAGVVGHREGSPMFALRNFLEADHLNRKEKRMQAKIKLSGVIYAWNKYRIKSDCKIIKTIKSISDDLPEIL